MIEALLAPVTAALWAGAALAVVPYAVSVGRDERVAP